MSKYQPEWEALGNGEYRILGRGFHAKVRMFWSCGEYRCNVLTCNNVMINAWDIQLWCARNIR